MAAAEVADNAVGDLAEMVVTGGVQSVPRRVLASAIRNISNGMTGKNAAKIADVLYEKDPAKKLIILKEIQNSGSGAETIKAYFTITDRMREIGSTASATISTSQQPRGQLAPISGRSQSGQQKAP
jgi:hypothetical protein